MIEKTICLYKFDELSDEVKEEILNRNRQINVEHDWWEWELSLLEPTKEDLDSIGVNEQDLDGNLFDYSENKMYFDFERNYYLGFGDIEVNNEEAFRRLLKIPKSLWRNTYFMFDNEGARYERNTKLYLELDLQDEEEHKVKYLEGIADECYDEAKDIWDDIMNRAWRILRDNYEDLMSDEAVAETIRINEYTFLEDGERWG
jgi:hypothetical protein